ncbi:MAG: GNAT family N-acetyltransferase [Desulfobacteraceae bacterium]|nr:GNAT family N-acetyltransferase [Desulfobacteraceae bacterium]
MELEIREDCTGVDWAAVSKILEGVGMGHYEPDVHKKAFEASHRTVFTYHSDRLIGFGRAISDGVYQAAIYDCAVLPEFQGRGIGRTIMEKILSKVPHCNVILYASPGKEGFYQTHGFRKMKTGMALFKNAGAKKEAGYIE